MDAATNKDEFSWLEGSTIETRITGLANRAREVMAHGGEDGKPRVWYTDGEYIWFRRSKANPATLQRHNKFCEIDDYKHVETVDDGLRGDIEVYELQETSIFKTDKVVGRQMDVSRLTDYDLTRQAAMAAVKHDWQAFMDIMSYLRERITLRCAHPSRPSEPTPLADTVYAETYTGVMLAIQRRNGPSPDYINQQLHQLKLRKNGGIKDKKKIITFGT